MTVPSILGPAAVLVLWSLIVMLWMVATRFPAFAKAGIPSVLVAEGTQYLNINYSDGLSILVDYFENIYHTPFDDLNQIINFDAAINHLQIIYSLTYKTANYEDDINWKSGSPFINARLRSIAEKK